MIGSGDGVPLLMLHWAMDRVLDRVLDRVMVGVHGVIGGLEA